MQCLWLGDSLWLCVHRHVAASKGCYALAKWLIKKQHVDVNPIDQDGRTPLAVRAVSSMSFTDV
jgi:hypothetical protein